jgi:hypothetical protein
MIHLITYGNNYYNNSKKRLYNEALSSAWFDAVTLYGADDLDDEFKLNFKDILREQRGGGYWIWKPYIIKKHLDKIQDDDILIYLDAGCSINKNGVQRFKDYINMVNNNDAGIISFQMDHIEKKWTTSEIFQYFNIEENSEVKNSGQVIGGIQIIKKNPNSIKLINLWNEVLYTNPLLFTDYYNNNNQQSYFKDNRHDQSIFSIIRKLHNSIILNDETYFEPFGNEESLKYPFWATRLKC